MNFRSEQLRNKAKVGGRKGGRKPGVPNKTTSEMREILSTALSTEISNLSKYISEIDKAEIKVKLMIDLLPFIMPKYSNTTLDNTGEPIDLRGLPSWFYDDDDNKEIKMPTIIDWVK